MPVTDITKDVERRTFAITAEFAAPVERVWALYADPRQLEKVWGPPEYPATFVDHDLRPGGRMTYYMTSPEGEKFAGTGTSSRSTSRAPSPSTTASPTPTSTPTPTCRSRATTTRSARTDGGTRAVFTSTFDSAEDLQKVLDMGIEEGATSAINQIDGFLANNTQNA